MKNDKEPTDNKVQVLVRDESLDKLDEVVLFPEKVDIAKKTLDRIGLPKISSKNS